MTLHDMLNSLQGLWEAFGLDDYSAQHNTAAKLASIVNTLLTSHPVAEWPPPYRGYPPHTDPMLPYSIALSCLLCAHFIL